MGTQWRNGTRGGAVLSRSWGVEVVLKTQPEQNGVGEVQVAELGNSKDVICATTAFRSRTSTGGDKCGALRTIAPVHTAPAGSAMLAGP